MDPNKRISAKDALNHAYFLEEPQMCLPKDLPRVEKESHEYELRMNKMKNANNQQQLQQAQQHLPKQTQGEMMIGNKGYQNNPNYYNKNQQPEPRFKIEESKTNPIVQKQMNTNSLQPSSNFLNSTSRLESILSSSKGAKDREPGEKDKEEKGNENLFLNNKRQTESSLESENISFKKQKFSPSNN